MEYGNENLLLRYEIFGRNGKSPRLQLLVLRQGDAVFYRTEKSRRDPDGPDLFIPISPAVKEAVRQILAQEALYQPEGLEKVSENWGAAHIYEFYFSDGNRCRSYRGVDLEYLTGRPAYPTVTFLFEVMSRLGEILIPEGVPAECFRPAEKTLAEPILRNGSRIQKSFPLYDFRKEKTPRRIGPPDMGARLEHYVLHKNTDGSVALELQVGWPGGTGHWDGAGSTYLLPADWFEDGFGTFLDKLTERYPASGYGFGRWELGETPGLKEFFGFSE